jgi:hypothetical protein
LQLVYASISRKFFLDWHIGKLVYMFPQFLCGLGLDVAFFTELEDYAVKHLTDPGARLKASAGCYVGGDKIPVFVIEP